MEKDCSCVADISLGPWGYETGKKWTFKSKHGGITQIILRSGGIVDSLVFKVNSHPDYSTKFGGKGGNRTIKINIDFPSEFLTGISGTYGSAYSFKNKVTSLAFLTNKTEHGPFGTKSGTPFSVNANGGVVTGFHGRYLEAIGLYIKLACALSINVKKQPSEIATSKVPRLLFPPRSAAAVGGHGGRDWDDGVFSAVKGVHVRVRIDTGAVSAVRFSYLKNDGSDFLSPLHGCYCAGNTHSKTIMLEKKEYLIGIEGFCGEVEGMGSLKVIKCLSFVTNKGKYGPVGAEMGTYFTCVNLGDCNNGKVVGFHGRSGAYLDAIGLHTLYFS
ncbi:hypothetical protein AAHA92_30974 [Salvia divinorum]|uniref:Jacalin-type lectin domain-containing protein n=1 Tax=Salvia divinorum TaxID=28513 RepID=A0ABD1FSN1_SALDI